MNEKTTLAALPKSVRARIIGFSADTEDQETRFREIGFAEGDIIEILHVGVFGKSPINVKLHGTSIAMRPRQAAMINIELLNESVS
ncbi:MAG: ferrous iron transport protein A [Acidimicrobiales bacterium]|nr:ferrous iron transport protein A [Hyphomonadaceae bacterium]RZV41743.1 MAG: ferrous iron transport protein A [Acidimicrobiales bacterium]